MEVILSGSLKSKKYSNVLLLDRSELVKLSRYCSKFLHFIVCEGNRYIDYSVVNSTGVFTLSKNLTFSRA